MLNEEQKKVILQILNMGDSVNDSHLIEEFATANSVYKFEPHQYYHVRCSSLLLPKAKVYGKSVREFKGLLIDIEYDRFEGEVMYTFLADFFRNKNQKTPRTIEVKVFGGAIKQKAEDCKNYLS